MELIYNVYSDNQEYIDKFEYERFPTLQDIKEYFKYEFEYQFKEFFNTEEKEDVALAMMVLLYKNDYMIELEEDERFKLFMAKKYIEEAEDCANDYGDGYNDVISHVNLEVDE